MRMGFACVPSRTSAWLSGSAAVVRIAGIRIVDVVVPALGKRGSLDARIGVDVFVFAIVDVFVQTRNPRHVQSLGEIAVETGPEVRRRDRVRRVVPSVVGIPLERTRTVGRAVLRTAVRVLVVHRARPVRDVARNAQLFVDGGVDVAVHLRALRERHVAVRAHAPVRGDGGSFEPAVVVHEVGVVEHLRTVDAEQHALGQRHADGHAVSRHARRRGEKREFRARTPVYGRGPKAHAQVRETAQLRADWNQCGVEVHAETVRSDRFGVPARGEPVVDTAAQNRLVSVPPLERPVDVVLHLLNGAHRRESASGTRGGDGTLSRGVGDVAERTREDQPRAERKHE